MAAAEPAQEWTWLARIRGPQGRKGEVFADILTDFPERFAQRHRLWLLAEAEPAAAPREVNLIAFWLHKGGVVLHFSGIDSISAAETLAGLGVAIPRAERAILDEDRVYIADLIGCTLVDVSKSDASSPEPVTPGVLVGVIDDVDLDAGPVALLVVKGDSGEVLVPYAKGYLRNVDLVTKRVEMALPEGLVDCNG